MSKTDQTLISECYNDKKDTIYRKEDDFNMTDMIILDVDDIKDTSGCIVGFHTLSEVADYVNKHVGNCYFVVYETFSSTDDKQKFRVIIPFDKPLRLLDREDVRAFKAYKCSMFPEFQDPKCQLWYFGPCKDLKEYGDPTIRLSSEYAASMMDAIIINNRAKDKLMSIARLFSADEERQAIATEQSNFFWSAQKVIDTINGARVGERDSLIFRSVCRMNPEDTSLVRSKITDPEKRSMFDEKVRRRKGH